MFTGIVQAIGTIKSIEILSDESRRISVKCSNLGSNFSIGESISVNGVCLTVESQELDVLTFTAVKETILKTNFKELEVDSQVNLERAATLSTFLGGHLVTGHVDKTLKILDVQVSKNWTVIEIEFDNDDRKYLIPKGSITINGVSLTVSDLQSKSFKTNLIPQTLSETNLKDLKVDDFVNIEFDLIGKYVLNKVLEQND
ncbi:MAG: riboflavin synthase [Candidatus Nanopelagicales bacterium]|jgi:riboflavin synthase